MLLARVVLLALLGTASALTLRAGVAPAARAVPVLAMRAPVFVAMSEEAATEAVDEGLPEGWKSKVDAATGRTYYYNAEGKTQWENPSASAQPTGYTTVYDDEVDTAPKKEELSATMRERLINESRGLGADPNQKNPFLNVFAAVGVFVVLGFVATNL